MKGIKGILAGLVIGFVVVLTVYLIGKGRAVRPRTVSLDASTWDLKTELSKKVTRKEQQKTPGETRPMDKNTFKVQLSKLKEAAARDPHNALRWIDIAKLYDAVGNHYKAYQYLKKALEMDPDFRYKDAVQEVITDYEENVLHNTHH